MTLYKIIPNGWDNANVHYTARKIIEQTSYGRQFTRYISISRVRTDKKEPEITPFNGVSFTPNELHSVEVIKHI